MFWLGIPVAATVLTVHLLIWALRRHTSPVVGVPVTVFATALALGGGLGLVNGGAPLLVLAWLPLSLALTLLHALTLGGRSVHGHGITVAAASGALVACSPWLFSMFVGLF
jgi:hypothetical protein